MNHSYLKPTFVICSTALLLGLVSYSLRKETPARAGLQATASVSPEPAQPAQLAPESDAVRQLKERGQYDSLVTAVQAARARVEPLHSDPAVVEAAAYYASNPWCGLRTEFSADRIHVMSSRIGENAWRWSVQFAGYGRGPEKQPAEPAEPVALDNRVEYHRGSLTEWYVNDQRGLEQGFNLAAPPDSANDSPPAPLALLIRVDTDLQARLSEPADSVQFVNDQGQPVLHYAGLKAWDATGRDLPATIELRDDGQLALLVNDQDAVYPVVIDPLIFTETKLTASDAAADDRFGYSVGISGNTVVVGAVNFDSAADSGAAYVFVRSGTSWSQQAKLTGSDAAAGDGFGCSVGISGDTVVIGAIYGDSMAAADSGTAYVFVRSGTSWSQQAKLTASDAAAYRVGYSVGISGDTVVAAANSGAAYVFVRSGTSWSQQAKLTGSDPAGDGFGYSVGISGDTVVAGAYLGDSTAAAGSGAAYVFVRSGTSWSQQARLTASDAAFGDAFGYSVGISGDTVVAAAPLRAAYVFVRSGTSWSQQAKLTASDAAAEDRFGYSVGISGDTVVVGAYNGLSTAAAPSGAAYVFVRSGISWSQQAKLTASDAAADDLFGSSVGISGATVVVGRPDNDSAYVYDSTTAADLLISQVASPTKVKIGALLTYTITVSNLGPNSAVNVVVNDPLPSSATFVSANANKGGFFTPPAGQNGTVTWYLGDMVSGEQETAQLKVTVLARGKTTLTNTATVHSDTPDPNPANNTTSFTVDVAPGGKKP